MRSSVFYNYARPLVSNFTTSILQPKATTMLKSISYPIFILFAILISGCQKEALVQPATTPPSEETLTAQLAEHEAILNAELAELEAELAGTARSQVVLPAGSVDGLAAAIAEAGPGGTVLVESGLHSESATVLIEHQVFIVGEEDAVLIFDTEPIEVLGFVEPALHFRNAARSLVRGVNFEVAGPVGGAAIVVEDSDRTVINRCSMEEFQFGVVIQNSDRVYAIRNTIAASSLWLTQTTIVQSFGIVVVNGQRARVYSNTLSGGITGIWACDRRGYIVGNEFFGNLEGIILCKVPPEYNYVLPNGDLMAAEFSGEKWAVFYNDSHDNFDYGYQIIDGAVSNFLVQNTASNNVSGSYEFAGETTRFGLPNPSPTSANNIAWIANDDSYLDCGDDNQIVGGVALDNTGGNCF